MEAHVAQSRFLMGYWPFSPVASPGSPLTLWILNLLSGLRCSFGWPFSNKKNQIYFNSSGIDQVATEKNLFTEDLDCGRVKFCIIQGFPETTINRFIVILSPTFPQGIGSLDYVAMQALKPRICRQARKALVETQLTIQIECIHVPHSAAGIVGNTGTHRYLQSDSKRFIFDGKTKDTFVKKDHSGNYILSDFPKSTQKKEEHIFNM